MRRLFSVAVGLAALALAGCEEALDPNAPLEVDFQVAAGHIHALETRVSYTAKVTALEGGARRIVADFETLAVEQSLEGTNAWRRLDLTYQPGTSSYTGTHRFINPGTYSTRLVGKRADQSSEMVLKELASSLTAVRSHFDAGGYRIEFDIDPGFPNELSAGTNYTLKFYILEDSDARPPITGLTGLTIRCIEADGSFTDHTVTEAAPGIYQATHTFTAGGDVIARLSFPGTAGAASVDMELEL